MPLSIRNVRFFTISSSGSDGLRLIVLSPGYFGWAAWHLSRLLYLWIWARPELCHYVNQGSENKLCWRGDFSSFSFSFGGWVIGWQELEVYIGFILLKLGHDWRFLGAPTEKKKKTKECHYCYLHFTAITAWLKPLHLSSMHDYYICLVFQELLKVWRLPFTCKCKEKGELSL